MKSKMNAKQMFRQHYTPESRQSLPGQQDSWLLRLQQALVVIAVLAILSTLFTLLAAASQDCRTDMTSWTCWFTNGELANSIFGE